MYFDWKDTYSVNVAAIDMQHKKIFEIGEKISDLVLAKDGTDHDSEITDILDELRRYTNYHFDFEEKLMEKHGYKGLEFHKSEHVYLRRKLERIEEKNSSHNQKAAIVDLIAFISEWISNHILQKDMMYKGHFTEAGIDMDQ